MNANFTVLTFEERHNTSISTLLTLPTSNSISSLLSLLSLLQILDELLLAILLVSLQKAQTDLWVWKYAPTEPFHLHPIYVKISEISQNQNNFNLPENDGQLIISQNNFSFQNFKLNILESLDCFCLFGQSFLWQLLIHPLIKSTHERQNLVFGWFIIVHGSHGTLWHLIILNCNVFMTKW